MPRSVCASTERPPTGGDGHDGHGPVPTAIVVLAILALIAQALDLVSAIRMVQQRGIASELNPLAHAIVRRWGPELLAAVKIGGVVGGVLVMMWVSRRGKVALAAAALVITAVLGLVGYYSNL